MSFLFLTISLSFDMVFVWLFRNLKSTLKEIEKMQKNIFMLVPTTRLLLFIDFIVITYSCEEVYPQCASLARGNIPLMKLIM